MSTAAKRLSPLKGEKLKSVQQASLVFRHASISRAGESHPAPKKAGQPTKGKYANVATNSEQFAANKQEEIDLEEHLQ